MRDIKPFETEEPLSGTPIADEIGHET